MFWKPSYTLDQGAEGECVGYGTAGTAASAPNPKTLVIHLDPSGDETEDSTAEKLYIAAQVYDGTIKAGGTPDEQAGASVLSGLKAAKDAGLITSYHSAPTIAECITALTTMGPLVMGTDWYEGMMNPDSKGFIAPTGKVAGGHCWEVDWINAARDTVGMHQSWGSGWGVSVNGVPGHAYIKLTDFARLLATQGEAWVIVK